jgi:nicotinate-nucleotide adenylyltransferase
MERMIGVFGGTFDPPHYGHLLLAETAWQVLDLSYVLWVVTATPPHKKQERISPITARIDMVSAAIASNPKFVLSDAEINRPGPHYAVDTLDLLRESSPNVKFAYLMGEDSLVNLPSWHKPDQFVARCDSIGVMSRPTVRVDLESLETQFQGIRKKIIFFDAPQVAISAKEIRERIRNHHSSRYLLPENVANIIEEQRLYR